MTEQSLILLFMITVVLLTGVYISWRAGRLDRLHLRLETAEEAVDAALVRRSATALELAASRWLDPATSLLLSAAAHEARTAARDHREMAESNLSRALRAVAEQPGFRESLSGREGGKELLEELDAACARVAYSRRFYNDAVAVTRTAQQRRLARMLRLAGYTEAPEFFNIDDEPPSTQPSSE